MRAQDGGETVGAEVDDSLPIATADSDSAGAGDCGEEPSIWIADMACCMRATAGTTFPASTGSCAKIGLALGKFAENALA